jgi:hypothetical protein
MKTFKQFIQEQGTVGGPLGINASGQLGSNPLSPPKIGTISLGTKISPPADGKVGLGIRGLQVVPAGLTGGMKIVTPKAGISGGLKGVKPTAGVFK